MRKRSHRITLNVSQTLPGLQPHGQQNLEQTAAEYRRPVVSGSVSSVTLTAFYVGLRLMPAIGGERAAHVGALLKLSAWGPANETLVATGIDKFALSGTPSTASFFCSLRCHGFELWPKAQQRVANDGLSLAECMCR
jgi:hypothetical protein